MGVDREKYRGMCLVSGGWVVSRVNFHKMIIKDYEKFAELISQQNLIEKILLCRTLNGKFIN